MQHAQVSNFLTLVGSRGGRLDVPGTLAVLPRKVLDEIVCRGAVTAGARMFAPLRFTSLIEENGVVVGARLNQSSESREIHARWVILATGAVVQGLQAAGMVERQAPSAIAMRCYVKNEAMSARINKLEVIWDSSLAPGYGWIFPVGNGVFNIGVGVSCNVRNKSHDKGNANLRGMFEAFCRLYEPARALMAEGTQLSDLKGAPLRCNLHGTQLSRPGVLVAGEASGTTYDFTYEGIGKALETGILAANSIRDGQGRHESDVRADYEGKINALRPRFAMYEKANLVNRYPWLADLVIWRARKSPRLQQRVAGILNETSNLANLFTLKGVKRLFTE